MKKKRIFIKIITIIMLFQLVILPTVSHASILGDIFSQAKNFLQKGQNGSTTIDQNEIKGASSDIFNVLVAIGTVLAVVIGGILGIQFMMASAEDKAKIKEAFIPYILGCVIIFGAFAIWSLVVNVLQPIAT